MIGIDYSTRSLIGPNSGCTMGHNIEEYGNVMDCYVWWVEEKIKDCVEEDDMWGERMLEEKWNKD